jgi:hypothetical protein
MNDVLLHCDVLPFNLAMVWKYVQMCKESNIFQPSAEITSFSYSGSFEINHGHLVSVTKRILSL